MSTINSQISLKAFCFASSLFSVILFAHYFGGFDSGYLYPLCFLHIVASSCFFYYSCPSRHNFPVAIIALSLGYVFGCGLVIVFIVSDYDGWSSWSAFGIYLCLLSFFHFSEYYTISLVNPKSLNLDSFLVNHSVAYAVSIAASCLEFVVEKCFFPDMKTVYPLISIGIVICIAGEAVRKGAMFTTRSNFSHLIQIRPKEGHMLITHGIYSWIRHPAYVGFFYWSLGTQVVLCNPICFIGFTLASWNFFSDRIEVEEITLLNFFGEDYIRYQNRVPTGLPFIKGYRIEL